MIGGKGRWRSLLERVEGLSVLWLGALGTLRGLSGQEDGAQWCMERRRDGCRDRPAGDHLLAMQGPRGLETGLKVDIARLLEAWTGSGPLLVTYFEALEGVKIDGSRKWWCEGFRDR